MSTIRQICILAFLLLALPVLVRSQDVPVDTARVFTSLAEAVKQPASVYKLSLKNARLSAVPPEVFSFPHLRYLDLSRNRISVVPDEIGNLFELERLNLSNNLIDTLPESIGQLHALVFLGLNRNRIRYLPTSVGDLSSLEVLELWDNELEDVPDEISRLQNLRVLELRGILFTDEQQARIDALVVKTAKVYMSPSCNCKN